MADNVRIMRKVFGWMTLAAMSFILAGTAARAATPMTKLSVHVLTPGGKPLDRASVIINFVSGRDALKADGRGLSFS